MGSQPKFPQAGAAMRPGRNSIGFGLGAGMAAMLLCIAPAYSLSETKPAEVPATGTQATEPLLPAPDATTPATPGGSPATVPEEPAAAPETPAEEPGAETPAETAPAEEPADTEPGAEAPAGEEPRTVEPKPGAAPVKPGSEFVPAEVQYDIEKLPVPVKNMRELIIEAARKGDLEALRPLIGTGADTTQLSFGNVEGDPIEFIKGLSGDEEGHEILAILEEVMQAGYVKMDGGSEQEIYVWPYFAGVDIEKLTPPQRVELFKIVTAGDFEDMKTYGAYVFYRVGITPDGKWQFFVAGD